MNVSNKKILLQCYIYTNTWTSGVLFKKESWICSRHQLWTALSIKQSLPILQIWRESGYKLYSVMSNVARISFACCCWSSKKKKGKKIKMMGRGKHDHIIPGRWQFLVKSFIYNNSNLYLTSIYSPFEQHFSKKQWHFIQPTIILVVTL